MNLDLFDNIDGLVLRERENSLISNNAEEPAGRSDNNGSMPEFPENTPLGMAYVPFQQWGDVKSPEDALECGTLFSDLVFPFQRGGGK